MIDKPDKPEDAFEESIYYEVWVNDDYYASADSRANAMHYAAQAAGDGEVEVWKVIQQKERIL